MHLNIWVGWLVRKVKPEQFWACAETLDDRLPTLKRLPLQHRIGEMPVFEIRWIALTFFGRWRKHIRQVRWLLAAVRALY